MSPKLLVVFDEFIKLKTGKVKPQTLAGFMKVRGKLVRYSDKYGYLDLADLNKKWFDSFVKAMVYGKIGKCSNKTIALYTTILTGFLKEAEGNGYAVNSDFTRFKSRLSEHKKSRTLKAILTEEEILALWSCKDLTSTQDLVKDLFIFQTQTGLRYGDLARIKKGNIKEKNGEFYLVDFSTQKRAVEITIHLNSLCMFIIQKRSKRFKVLQENSFVFSKVPSVSNATGKLKAIAKAAKLDREVKDEIAFGGKLLARSRKLYEALGTHCARHTFASAYMLGGGDIWKLKNLIGHKNIATTEAYVHTLPGFIPDGIEIRLNSNFIF